MVAGGLVAGGAAVVAGGGWTVGLAAAVVVGGLEVGTAAAVVAGGAVVVGDDEQPEITKAATKSITSGMSTFFITCLLIIFFRVYYNRLRSY